MSHISGRRSLAVPPSITAGLLALAVACSGTGPISHQSGRGTQSAIGTTQPGSLSPAPRPSYPNASRYADPLERYAYKEAFGRCSALGLGAVTDSYGGMPGHPASAAAAYAATTYPTSGHLRLGATQGCLDGLRVRG
ncbi:MAG: hypothetical protein M3O88_05360 [Actinomycetota bacterium]|nr:hypothetical protein [Actinomycetota bacterium]